MARFPKVAATIVKITNRGKCKFGHTRHSHSSSWQLVSLGQKKERKKGSLLGLFPPRKYLQRLGSSDI